MILSTFFIKAVCGTYSSKDVLWDKERKREEGREEGLENPLDKDHVNVMMKDRRPGSAVGHMYSDSWCMIKGAKLHV